ncbi:hypothetical protein VTJ04DRAFT_1063 [Mycothermus thermophilus]|uniref:uncharacterized protein n=1 Tax=Humicola insolens TaxID=85995 RepID=UPI003742E253
MQNWPPKFPSFGHLPPAATLFSIAIKEHRICEANVVHQPLRRISGRCSHHFAPSLPPVPHLGGSIHHCYSRAAQGSRSAAAVTGPGTMDSTP